MFVLAEMKKVVKITPDLFHLKLSDAIASEINNKLANKVVLNVGLCIALYDITDIQESYIFPGDGSSHTRVSFRYIVFRPFMDEILVGKIRSSDAEGLHGFFDDIIIPHHALQHPSQFNEREQVWVWEYNNGDGGDKHELFMDSNETIRFKVTAEWFHETNVPSSNLPNANAAEHKVPYIITGSINEPGLGLLSWWEN